MVEECGGVGAEDLQGGPLLESLGVPELGRFRLGAAPIGEALTDATAPVGDQTRKFLEELTGFDPELAEPAAQFIVSTLTDPSYPLRRALFGETEISGRDAIGLGLDVFADPANLIPLNFFGNIIRKGADLTGLRPILQRSPMLRRVFPSLQSQGEKQAAEIGFANAGQARKRIRQSMDKMRAMRDRVMKIAKRRGVDPTEVNKEILDLAHSPIDLEFITRRKIRRQYPAGSQVPLDLAPRLEDEIVKAEALREVMGISQDEFLESSAEALRYRSAIEEQKLHELRNGLGKLEVSGPSFVFLETMLSTQGRNALLKHGIFDEATQSFRPHHATRLVKIWKNRTPSELNTLAREGKLPGLEGVKIDKLFEDDPGRILVARTVQGEHALADIQTVMKAIDTVGIKPDNVEEFFAKYPGEYRQLNLPRGPGNRNLPLIDKLAADGVVFPTKVADHLENYFDVVTNPKRLREFFDFWDEVTRRWKGSTTVIFPGFHNRNAISNMWNNYLAGMNDPTWYMRALDFQGMRNSVTRTVRLGDREIPFAELDRMLEDFGVTNQFMAYMGLEEASSLTNYNTGLKRIKNIGRGKAVQTGMNIAGAVEDNARVAHFMWRLNEGDTPIKAAMSVKRYLFDYSSLSPFEKVWFRDKLFPFYAWTRFNLPLQVERLVNNPGRYQPLGDFVELFERTNVGTRDDFEGPGIQDFGEFIGPEEHFLKEAAGVPTRIGPNGEVQVLLLEGWLGAGSLSELGNLWTGLRGLGRFEIPEVPGLVSELLSPIPTQFVERLANRNLFTQRDVQSFEGEVDKFAGVEMPKTMINVLRGIRIASVLDKLLKTDEVSGALGIEDQVGLTRTITDEETGIETKVRTKDGGDLQQWLVNLLFGVNTFSTTELRTRRRLLAQRDKLFRQRQAAKNETNKAALQRRIDLITQRHGKNKTEMKREESDLRIRNRLDRLTRP